MPLSRRADFEVVFMFSLPSSAQDRFTRTTAVRHDDQRGIDVALVMVARSRRGAGDAQGVGFVVGVFTRLLEGARKDVDLGRHDVRIVDGSAWGARVAALPRTGRASGGGVHAQVHAQVLDALGERHRCR